MDIVAQQQDLSQKQIQILKATICKGLDDNEFAIFLMACQRMGLDPFMKHVHAIKRKSRQMDGTYKDQMTIQVGIDGYRCIAERTGCYAPGPEPTFSEKDGKIISATAFVRKMTRDGTWHEVSASAYWDEYCPKGRDGEPTGLWRNMPHGMIAKCAESLALRKAFPAEMSGTYTREEMQQADVEISSIPLEQAAELEELLSRCPPDYQEWVRRHLRERYSVHSLDQIPPDLIDRLRTSLEAKAVRQEVGHATAD